MNKYLTTIVALLAIVGGVFGAVTYFASASDLQATEQRLNNYILGDRYAQVQERIWKIEDRYELGTSRSRAMPQSVKEELRELRKELELLKAKLRVNEG